MTDTVKPNPSAETAPPKADPAFPRLHPRPDRGWVNDPNGLARIDGRWHVFFQWNPESARHHRIHWGHVSSEDLVHWTAEPTALVPREGHPDSFGCFTGCLVDDAGTPTAVYSAVTDRSGSSDVLLARADRDLREWRQDEQPVLPMPADQRFTDIRDPFLFEHAGHRWAIIGAGRPHGEPGVLAFRVDDLTTWVPAGTLLDSGDAVAASVAPANIWECPNLVHVEGRWILILSLWRSRDDAEPRPRELHGVRYLVGDLKVTADLQLRFKADSGGTLDDGPAFYAPQILAAEGRALMWGWSWELRDEAESDTAGWAGSLTHPRELHMLGDKLVSRPAAELASLIRTELAPDDSTLTEPAFLVRFSGPGSLNADGRPVATLDQPGDVWVDGSIVEAFPESGVPYTTRGYPKRGWTVSGPAQAYKLGLEETSAQPEPSQRLRGDGNP